MWQFSGALRPPSPLGSMLDLVLMVEFLRLTALKFSTLTRGEGGCDHFFTFMWSDPSMMPSFFVAFLSVKTIKKFFDMTSYFPQNRTLWPGQSLSSPIRERFSDPQMERFVECNSTPAYAWIRLQHLSFQHWLGGEGVGDHFFTFMWSDASMMFSFFVAFLSVKTIKLFLKFWIIFPKNVHFERVSL